MLSPFEFLDDKDDDSSDLDFFFLCHLAMEGAEEKEHIHPNYEGDAVNGSITNQNNDNKEGTRGTMKESPGNHMSRNSMHHKIAFENFVVPVCN